jgi:hypothetical protein
MSTEAIIAVAVGAVVVIALVVFLAKLGRKRQLDTRREKAGELRQEAHTRGLRAERERAAADEQAARAKQAQAEAEERAATARRESAAAQERAQVADRERKFARERHQEARSIDPDVDDDADGEDRNGDGRTSRNGREPAAVGRQQRRS